MITLCKKCHKAYHNGKIQLSVKKHKALKAETAMSILRWKIIDKLKELGNTVNVTYGYITKSVRIALKLDKSHNNDAFCIAGGNWQERTNIINGFYNRRQNRCTQLNRNGFKPSIRRQKYQFQPNDLVKFNGKAYIVKGIQNLGRYIKLDGLKKLVKTESVNLIKYGKGLQFTPAL